MKSSIAISRVSCFVRSGCLPIAASVLLYGLTGCGSGIKQLVGGTSTPASAVKDGPQLGYAWKADDRTLRPFLGVAGSSQIGESVVTAGAYATAASSSASGIALLVDGQGKVFSMVLPTGEPAPLDVTVAGAAQIRFSPSGAAAVVFARGAQSASLITSLTGQPQVKQLTVAAPIQDAAVSDGAAVAAVLQSSSGTTLQLTPAQGAARQVQSFVGTGAIAFFAKTDDLLAADSGSEALLLIRNVSSTPSAVPLPTGNLLKGAVAVGAAAGEHWAVVANGGESSVVRIDLTGATGPQRILCPVQPQAAAPLMGNGTFLFTPLADGPLWIADITQASPAMIFIPALPSSSEPSSSIVAAIR